MWIDFSDEPGRRTVNSDTFVVQTRSLFCAENVFNVLIGLTFLLASIIFCFQWIHFGLCPSGIHHRDSNSRPLDYESPALTTKQPLDFFLVFLLISGFSAVYHHKIKIRIMHVGNELCFNFNNGP